MAFRYRARRFAQAAAASAAVLASFQAPLAAFGQAPTAAQALRLAPVQKEVEHDVPAADAIGKCTIKAEKINGQTGWIVRDANGQILREFLDTNKDNVVDRWTYYKDGMEVYRDIDENFNGKPDQHRWLTIAGSKWGIDRNEDGKVDSWKSISPEEVTAELVLALRDKDADRFERLLLTAAELRSLGLSAAKSKELGEKIDSAKGAFAELARKQKVVGPKTTWIHFGGTRPGLIPAGTDGSTADITAYENVMAMIESEGKDGQVPVGTLVKVGDLWRLIDLPALGENAKNELAGYFFAAPNRSGDRPEASADAPSEKVQKLVEEAQKLDTELASAGPDQQAKLNDRRADLLNQIIDESDPKDRANWVRNFADTVSAATQSGTFPNGVERLNKLFDQVAKGDDADLTAYVKFRCMTADYGLSLQQPNPDFTKIQNKWLENLEKYAEAFPKSSDAADAMLQLGLAQEVAGQEQKAKEWYGKIVEGFPDTTLAKKAAGAITRLDSVGKPITLRGKSTLQGDLVDLAKFKGKYVLVHYWAAYSEPCKVDLAQLKELYAKYGKSGLAMVGVSLDNDPQELNDYLKKNKLPWPQIFEPGGLDSRLANEMGILTLPTMILLDDTGKVINRGIHITELDSELRAKLK